MTFSRGVLQYGYDTAGRVSTLVDPGGVSLAFTYDGALPLTETWSGLVTGAVARTFTTNFEIATEQVAGTAAVSFGYDADRLLTHAGALTIDRDAATGLVSGTTWARRRRRSSTTRSATGRRGTHSPRARWKYEPLATTVTTWCGVIARIRPR